MKPFLSFMILTSGILLSGVYSCKEALSDNPVDDPLKMVEVSFSPEIDGIDLEVVPLEAKVSNREKTFYLITINGDNSNMCGLFDSSLENAKIQLPAEKTYYISMLVIQETEHGHLIPFSGPEWEGTDYEGAYMNPFVTRYSMQATNNFVNDRWTVYLTPQNPVCDDENGSSYNSFVYRYVGYEIVENLQTDRKIPIHLKRYYFSINLNITPPIDGSLEVSIPDFHFSETIAPGEDVVNLSRIVNSRQEATNGWNDFPGENNWAADEFSEDHELVIKWTRAEGLTSYKIKKTISFSKGAQHNINININDRAGSIGFDPLIDDTALTETTIDID